MAFEANSSSEEIVKSQRLFTGVVPMRVIAINPDKAAFEAMGINKDTEPNYITDGPNGKVTRVEFWLSPKAGTTLVPTEGGKAPVTDLKTKVAFFLSDEEVMSRTGKHQYINKYGVTCWETSVDAIAYTWFKQEGVRIAKKGEADLYEFLIKWLNVSNESEVQLENLAAIISGNMAELRGYWKKFADNEVKALLSVRQDKETGNHYQDVYSRYFDRASTKNNANFTKHLGKNPILGTDKNNFFYSVNFEEYEPTVSAPAGKKFEGGSSQPSGTEDDTPF